MQTRPGPLQQEHVGILIQRLAAALKCEKMQSVLEAVPRAFVAVRMGADKSDPLLPYTQTQLRLGISQLSPEQRDSLDQLCEGYEHRHSIAFESSLTGGEVNKHLRTIPNCTELLDRIARNSEMGSLAIHYNVPLTTIPAMFKYAVETVARHEVAEGRLDEAKYGGRHKVLLQLASKPLDALQMVAAARPQWIPFSSYVYDQGRKVFRPNAQSWGFPPSHREIDIYEKLKGEKAMAVRPEQLAVASSLSQSPQVAVPTRTGKSAYTARAAAHTRG